MRAMSDPQPKPGIMKIAAYKGGDGSIPGVSDPIRSGAFEALEALRRQGVKIAMITGDGEAPAHAVGQALGIEDIRAETPPDEKYQAVASLRKAYGPIAFIGDGINDAAALAEAEFLPKLRVGECLLRCHQGRAQGCGPQDHRQERRQGQDARSRHLRSELADHQERPPQCCTSPCT